MNFIILPSISMMKQKTNTIRKNFHIHLSRQQFKRLLRKPFYKKFNTQQLIDVMKKCGMKEGSNVFIHSSWGEFYKYTGTSTEFIEAILETIGPKGTIGMPAFPKNKYELFDVRKTPSYAGYLTEVFRNYPGVKRSLNSQHSVCAIGPMSGYLLNEHHLSETCWDKKSPYYRMAQINSIVFMLGLEAVNIMPTIWHCTESILKDEFPYYSQLLSKKITVQYIDYNGKIIYHGYYTKPDNIIIRSRNRAEFVEKYFDKSKYIHAKLSNLIIRSYDSNYTVKRLLELARKGITRYELPDPAGFFKIAQNK